ncbi:hypothetical protein [Desulforamulus ferrireducens]|uniref:Uncharacterized protein n=1 Tax=Desulforamulus ferrireducens TaxID=1833852 RepID=A0A1S6IVW1_9FIRM|nr:hypothetical protein [Desulforamulus ferrireducens]AQS58903.1 hypothetical protein B0537_07280 [Desulforamulus ferrireducens]
MQKYFGMAFLSIIPLMILAHSLPSQPNYQNYICATILLLPILFFFHFNFILFPEAVKKSDSLFIVVKIIYSSLEETILDKELKSTVKTKINNSLLTLGATMDERRKYLTNPQMFRPTKIIALDNAWRNFFIEAFSIIEKDLKDETLATWTFNKIQHKMNDHVQGQRIRNILKEMLGDSRYSFICK